MTGDQSPGSAPRPNRPLKAERFPGIDETDGVIEDGLPAGLCIWRYPRGYYQARNGSKNRTRLYSVTHASSGVALISGRLRTLAAARKAAWALADVRYRNKPIDLTKTVEQLRAVDRFRLSALALGGWYVLSNDYDAETQAWADRNGIDLEGWKSKKKERTDA